MLIARGDRGTVWRFSAQRPCVLSIAARVALPVRMGNAATTHRATRSPSAQTPRSDTNAGHGNARDACSLRTCHSPIVLSAAIQRSRQRGPLISASIGSASSIVTWRSFVAPAIGCGAVFAHFQFSFPQPCTEATVAISRTTCEGCPHHLAGVVGRRLVAPLDLVDPVAYLRQHKTAHPPPPQASCSSVPRTRRRLVLNFARRHEP